jgi:hypothetical protein
MMPLSAAIAIFSAALACPAPDGAHSAPTPASAPTSDHAAHHSGVDSRGDHVMGFDHATTTHHFRLFASGGSIEVTANDPADTAGRDAIRMHLSHIAGMFAEGDFQAPMLIHDRVPPGVPAMKALREKILWKFEPIDRGGVVRASTRDAKALSAIHEFLLFQIEDHRTGDPATISDDPPPRPKS